MPLQYLWVSLPMRFYMFKRYNGNVHRAAAKVLQAEKPAQPAAPCASYCYPAAGSDSVSARLHDLVLGSRMIPQMAKIPLKIMHGIDHSWPTSGRSAISPSHVLRDIDTEGVNISPTNQPTRDKTTIPPIDVRFLSPACRQKNDGINIITRNGTIEVKFDPALL